MIRKQHWIAILAGFFALALPLAANAVVTKISVTQGGQPVEGATVDLFDASGTQIDSGKSDDDGAVYFDLNPGSNFSALANGQRSNPFQAGDSVTIRVPGAAPGAGGIVISLEAGPAGVFIDSSTSVDGSVSSSREVRIQDPIFFDRFTIERVDETTFFSANQNVDLDSAVGTLTARIDGPPVGPGGSNPFFTIGSNAIFNSPSERSTSPLSGGGEFELRSKLESNLNFGLGGQIPVCRDNCPFPVNVDAGLGFAWNEISYRGMVGGDSIKQTTDVWYMGPVAGVSGVVHENKNVIVSVYVNGGYLFEISGGSEKIRVGSGSNSATIELESDGMGFVGGGVRVGFKPGGN